MNFDTADHSSPLLDKFHRFYEQFAEFSQDAAEMHSNLEVHDDASRAAFNSLSRILGFADQLNLVVSLMREDVRVVEELTAAPVAAKWTEAMDNFFYEWLKSPKAAIPNMN